MWCLVVSIPDLCSLSYFSGRTVRFVGFFNGLAQLSIFGEVSAQDFGTNRINADTGVSSEARDPARIQ